MKLTQSELTFYMTRIFMGDFFKAYEVRDSAIKFLTSSGYDVKIERDDQGHIVDVVVEEHVAIWKGVESYD